MYGTSEQFRQYLNSNYLRVMSYQMYLRLKAWPFGGPVIVDRK